MTIFGWRVVSVALIIAFSDVLVKAFTPDNEESGKELSPDARSAYFSQNDFSYLNINPIGASLVVQSIQCALTCLQHLSCFSFNLAAFPDDNGKLLCEHLLSDKYNYSEKFVASHTYHHFSIWSPCFSAPCKNNGQCMPLYKQNSYLCVCNKQFTGEHCENWRASKSCKDLRDNSSNADGEYWIDRANDGKHLKVFCDMTTDGGGCRQLHFPLSLQKTDRRLIGHNITIKLVRGIDECYWHCCEHPYCVSINFRTTANKEKRHRCELNNATYKKYVKDLAETNGFIYLGAENPCESSPCKNGGTCQSGYTDKGYRCVCRWGFSSFHCERVSKSCKDIWDIGASKGSGEYWIDPANDEKHLKVFCDMTTDGGGWLLVSRLNITQNFIPQSPLPWVTSYRGIENQTLLTQTAMKELRRLINFTQLRFHCKKQEPNRTIHIATVKNSSGEAVVQYFSGQRDYLPIACDSFYKMKDDNSELANKCQRWGRENGQNFVGKWGHETDNTLGSDQKETRLFNHAMFVFTDVHWVVDHIKKRFECDDFNHGGTTDFSGGLWEIFVR